jgi:hypothetical protein
LVVAVIASGEARLCRAEPIGPELAIYALIVGVNQSVDADLPPLRYADDDAARYQDLFRSLGARTYLLTRPDQNTRRISPQAVAEAREPRQGELGRAVAALAADVAQARARGVRTLFYFVYAGHGNLRGSDAYLALEDARLTGADIEREVVDGVHADQTHVIVDACYSYFLAYGRGPGGTRREVHGFAPVEGLARRTDVGLLLSTTSARESHEWEGFQAGIFSHEVRSGLYGAADLDGDGRVSYREIAAFVERANAAIPNERFRPEVFARAPRGEPQLIDLRGGLRRHLRVDGATHAGHFLLEDARGVRLADFHNARGHSVALLRPGAGGALYLRAVGGDEREFEIPAAPDLVALEDLEPREPRAAARGAAHEAFSLIFSLPFDEQALAAYGPAQDGADLVAAAGPAAPAAPRWSRRSVAAASAAGVAVAASATALALTMSARGLADDARNAPTQKETAALNDRVAARNLWAGTLYGVAAAAAVAAGAIWLWPRAPVQPAVAADQQTAMVGLGGRF